MRNESPSPAYIFCRITAESRAKLSRLVDLPVVTSNQSVINYINSL